MLAGVPDCVELTPENAGELNWLPRTCAYRLLAEGRDLAWWHPLVSGRAETVVEAGISVKGRTRSEEHFAEEELREDVSAAYPFVDRADVRDPLGDR